MTKKQKLKYLLRRITELENILVEHAKIITDIEGNVSRLVRQETAVVDVKPTTDKSLVTFTGPEAEEFKRRMTK